MRSSRWHLRILRACDITITWRGAFSQLLCFASFIELMCSVFTVWLISSKPMFVLLTPSDTATFLRFPFARRFWRISEYSLVVSHICGIIASLPILQSNDQWPGLLSIRFAFSRLQNTSPLRWWALPFRCKHVVFKQHTWKKFAQWELSKGKLSALSRRLSAAQKTRIWLPISLCPRFLMRYSSTTDPILRRVIYSRNLHRLVSFFWSLFSSARDPEVLSVVECIVNKLRVIITPQVFYLLQNSSSLDVFSQSFS